MQSNTSASACSVGLSGCALCFQGNEEALHGGVIPDLARTAHAAGNALFLESSLEVLAGALASLVGVVQQRHRFATAAYSHHQSVSYQLRGHAVVH